MLDQYLNEENQLNENNNDLPTLKWNYGLLQQKPEYKHERLNASPCGADCSTFSDTPFFSAMLECMRSSGGSLIIY